MDPNPQPPTLPSTDPYDFLNESKRSHSNVNLASISFRGKILIGLGVAIIVVILLVIAKSLFGGNNSFDLVSLNAVLSEQQELITLATSGTQQSQVLSQSYLNFSYTTLGSATTDQMNLTKLLSYNGVKVNPNTFVLQPNLTTELQQAQQTSTFDSVYTSLMSQQLSTYKSELTNAYSLNKSAVIKSYLATDYKDAQMLVKMLQENYG